MNYRITHRTLYDYTAPVTVSHHVARLEPRGTPMQTRREYALEIEPAPLLRKARTDYFGNELCFFSIQEIHRRLKIVTSSLVSVNAAPTAGPGKFAGVGGGRAAVPRSGLAGGRPTV